MLSKLRFFILKKVIKDKKSSDHYMASVTGSRASSASLAWRTMYGTNGDLHWFG